MENESNFSFSSYRSKYLNGEVSVSALQKVSTINNRLQHLTLNAQQITVSQVNIGAIQSYSFATQI
jgi:hypothetical protein